MTGPHTRRCFSRCHRVIPKDNIARTKVIRFALVQYLASFGMFSGCASMPADLCAIVLAIAIVRADSRCLWIHVKTIAPSNKQIVAK